MAPCGLRASFDAPKPETAQSSKSPRGNRNDLGTSSAIIRSGALATSDDTHLVPALVADAGDQAAWRYLEFFTANIRNLNTRRAYARACNALGSAAANLASIEAVLTQARLTFSRQQQLLKDGWTPRANFDEAEQKLLTAQAQVDSARRR